MRQISITVKLIVCCFFIGIATVSGQDFFRVIGGIPHLPAIDPSSVMSPVQGMFIYSKTDKQPLVYNGTAWETLCSSNINTSTTKDYLEVKGGIPSLPSLSSDPIGAALSGSIYFSKINKTIMVNNGTSWNLLSKIVELPGFYQSVGFSTNKGLKISKLPVLLANPVPIGLSAGAIYINMGSKAIRFYDGGVWKDISCLPVISTISPTSISNVAAISGADIRSNGGSAIIEQGICWSTSANPDTTLKTKTRSLVFGNDIGLFPAVVSGLQSNTVYHVRAYAVNASGIVYGEDIVFTSAQALLATVTTIEVDAFSPVMANSGGIISNNGGAPITARGITWSSLGDPKDDDAAKITVDGSGVGSFPSRLIDLLRNTTYYVRAYAVNVMGKAFGNLLTFTTPEATAPVLSSSDIRVVEITDVSAVSHVNIINNGGELVTDRGISWSTDRINITYTSSATVNPSDVGTFMSQLNNLVPGTTYYIRGYATNSIGTSFTSESSFITTSFPTLTTVEPRNYDLESFREGNFASCDGTIAMSGGDITSNGVSPITKRGIVWSTTPAPTTELSTKSEQDVTGSGMGQFNLYLHSLTPGTTYFVRAYAVNSKGLAYGDEYSFKTPQLADLTTLAATAVTHTTITTGGNISDDGRVPVTSRGICWSTGQHPTYDDAHTIDGSGTGDFVSTIPGLLANSVYYFRAYAINNVGISYGSLQTVSTAPPLKPKVHTAVVNATAGSQAAGGGEVYDNGGASITRRGIVWSLIPGFDPDMVSAEKTEQAGQDGVFSSTLVNLQPNKTYYVRAYAVNDGGTGYGEELSFKTFTLPTLITTTVSGITNIAAVGGGTITADGGDRVTACGLVWSTSSDPTTNLTSKTQGGTGTGNFIHQLSGLLGSTVYYVRAYATNGAGTAYGNQVSFFTDPPALPVLSTLEATGITGISAFSGGKLVSNGGALFSASGVVWSTTADFVPDLEQDTKTVQSGTGDFTSMLTGLTPGTVYYVRAYAKNGIGLSFGNQVVFKSANMAAVTTLAPLAQNISSTSALSGGTVLGNGGSYITATGIVWSTKPEPTLADQVITAGVGSGTFTLSIDDLRGATTYYVRAYVTNAAGTAYGNEVVFTTKAPVLATVVTREAEANPTATSAVSGGNITSDGGATVSTRGIVWATEMDFKPDTVTKNKTAETGDQKGLFSSTLLGLKAGTTYYIRAYVVNSAGTAYGGLVSVTTPELGTVTTNAPRLVMNSTGLMGGTVTSTGNRAAESRGVLWSTLADFDPLDGTVSRTVNGAGLGTFDSQLSGLISDTKYYVRAYVRTSAGMAYGEQLSFTTLPPVLPVLTTLPVSGITGTTATGAGNIADEGGLTADTRGVVWSTQPNFDYTGTTVNRTAESGSGMGPFYSSLSGLSTGTTYYVRAYAKNNVGTAYGNEESFTTKAPVLATIVTLKAGANPKATSATGGGDITSDGDAALISRGLVWATDRNFRPDTVIRNKTMETSAAKGIFSNALQELKGGTTYYIRAYVVNSVGTSYGGIVSVTTPQLAVVTTNAPGLLTNRTALMGGTVTSNGGAAIEARGVLWSKVADFDPLDPNVTRTVNGLGMGTFDSQLSDLVPDTKYYVRAYVLTIAGLAYGQQLSFTTYPPTLPELTTLTPSGITGTTVNSGGNITDEGGISAETRGLLWSTQPNFDYTGTTVNKTVQTGAGLGIFYSSISGLTAGTTYYVRAYAKNGVGTAYGNELSFTTQSAATLTTMDPTEITATTVQTGGVVTHFGGAAVIRQGVCYSTTPQPTIAATVLEGNRSWEIFPMTIRQLKPVTTYYVRAFLTNTIGTAYGNEITFTTGPVLATVTTTDPVVVSDNALSSGGTISDDGGNAVTARGIVFSKKANFNPDTVVKNTTTDGQGLGSFISAMPGIERSTSYYIRAYAKNNAGTAYGEQLRIAVFPASPLLTTKVVSLITGTTAISGGEIVRDGGAPLTKRGIVWSTSRNPTVALDTKTSDVEDADGNFVSHLSGLQNNTTYYVRAYAVNGIGTAYGLEQTFTTLALPTLSATVPVTSILATTATSGGVITDDGRTPILSRGIVWGLYSNPTIALPTKTLDDTTAAIGNFAADLTALKPNTNYYVRAYATNSVGITYGSETVFKTNALVLPVVKTTAPADIQGVSAMGGGEVTYDGGTSVTARGIVWSLSPAPTVTGGTKLSVGSGLGVFTGMVAPLNLFSTYYYRAYATNSVGTAYGEELSFKTLAALPEVSLVTLSDITATSVRSTAAVTAEGGLPVTEKGFVWNITGMPTLDDTRLLQGTGLGDFNTVLSGLTEGITYYIRAYATNAEGTGYSPEVKSFRVCLPFTVTHRAGAFGAPVNKTVTYKTVSTNVSGAERCWITQNLGADHEATSATDATEASAGWLWQFNSPQGYKMDGAERTPATVWKAVNTDADWTQENDPCVQLLSGGWRMPTKTELINAQGDPQNWKNYTDGFNSPLKLHAAGIFNESGIGPFYRGTQGYYWSSTQASATMANTLYFTGNVSTVAQLSKTYAWSVRCLRDQVEIAAPFVSNVEIPAAGMTATGAQAVATVLRDGGAPLTASGFVWSLTANPTLSDNVLSKGTDIELSSTIGGLTEDAVYYVGAFATNSVGTSYSAKTVTFRICLPFTVNHKAGVGGAAVDKTVKYNTVSSTVTGSAKCWITQNLGADREAVNAYDATEAAAGWLWQFGMLQGYKADGGVRTPATGWVASNSTTDWTVANDPCVQLLGMGWRMPTGTELTTAQAAPQGWANYTDGFNSGLKFHTGGILNANGGGLAYRGTQGYYWASTQGSASMGISLYFTSNYSTVIPLEKTYAWSIRCLRDGIERGAPLISNVTLPAAGLKTTTAEATAAVLSDGGAEVTAKGFVWNTTGNPTIQDHTVASGAGSGEFNATLTDLSEESVYYVRAYATNSYGTTYSPVVSSFRLCLPLTIVHKAGVNGAPADKTITYQTVSTTASGEMKCWITQNLGAERQAAAATDATEPAVGWYWQFNRLQGYQINTNTRLPNTAWTTVTETSEWVRENDPCVRMLGGGWRLPTHAEWTAAYAAPQNWNNAANAYAGALKLHMGGWLDLSSGAKTGLATQGNYWSSTSGSTSTAPFIYFNTNGLATQQVSKSYGFPVRCLLDKVVLNTPSVSNPAVLGADIKATTALVSATLNYDGGTPVTAKGLVWNMTGNPTVADQQIVTTDGDNLTALLTGLKEGPTYYVRAFATNSQGTAYSAVALSFQVCLPLTVTHRANVNGAPIDKTITYQTVSAAVSGAAKCWITQNLGADVQALSGADVNESAAGWYWQFNKPQGHQVNGTTRLPAQAWETVNENSDWLPENDPCANLLGNGWRLPTNVEWTAAYAAPQNWNNATLANAGILKLHMGGWLEAANGVRNGFGTQGNYWSSTGGTATTTPFIYFNSSTLRSEPVSKSYAFTLRCLRDQIIITAPFVSNADMLLSGESAAGAATVTRDGGAPVTARGMVYNTTGMPTLADQVIAGGSGLGTFNGAIANLLDGTTYNVRAYATNAIGTTYSANVTRVGLCGSPFTINHVARLKGSAVTKSVTYQTVSSKIGGPAQCWILQNLGADMPASSVNDATEAAAGWYWQYNRLQGYKSDANGRSPATVWNSAMEPGSQWTAENDPCTQQLGEGWRIPTLAEWTTVSGAPQNWTSISNAYNSVLKLHNAGYLHNTDGSLQVRGGDNDYWSATNATYMYNASRFIPTGSAYGISVRCVRTDMTKTLAEVSNADMVLTTDGANGAATIISDGFTPVTAKGLVWNTTGMPTLADNVISGGSGAGAFSGAISGLRDGLTYYMRAFATNAKGTAYSPVVSSIGLCGTPFTVNHVAGAKGAPVTKSVTYQTVRSRISGTAQCWITQNLGADQQASNANDVAEGAAGWYWQFNRLQGYKNDGTTRTPATTWVGISEDSQWMPANDPCRQQLGEGWRIPTQAEWTTAAAAPQNWKSTADGYASVLKIHNAGYLMHNSGALMARGSDNDFWSSTQTSATTAMYLSRANEIWTINPKNYAFNLRCIRADLTKTIAGITDAEISGTGTSRTGSASVIHDGYSPVTARGLVWNTTGSPTLADHVVNSGTGTGAFTGDILDIQDGLTYYIRAFATNAIGTVYSSNDVRATACNPFTVNYTAGVKGAAVTKTVNYTTVSTNITGTDKCWITQNLGADRPATAVGDATEAAAGWYWQFNKLQGYAHDGTTRSPATAWISSINEDSQWIAANDPCTQQLGAKWRVPTESEWIRSYGPPQNWSGIAAGFNGVLKLHNGGYLHYSNGSLLSRGSDNDFWSSTQSGTTTASYINNANRMYTTNPKSYAFSLRCIRD